MKTGKSANRKKMQSKRRRHRYRSASSYNTIPNADNEPEYYKYDVFKNLILRQTDELEGLSDLYALKLDDRRLSTPQEKEKQISSLHAHLTSNPPTNTRYTFGELSEVDDGDDDTGALVIPFRRTGSSIDTEMIKEHLVQVLKGVFIQTMLQPVTTRRGNTIGELRIQKF